MKVALASYPRSGNTWMRVLLEASTGRTVPSVSMDKPYPNIGKGSPVAIKTHHTDRESTAKYDQVIHLVRHPYDCIESFFHFRNTYDYDPPKSWDAHVRQCVPDWAYHTNYWRKHRHGLHVRYEDMLEDPERELQRVLTFLGLEVGRDRIEYALGFTFEKLRQSITNGTNFYRRGTSGDGKDAFLPEQRDWVCSQLGNLVGRYSYAL